MDKHSMEMAFFSKYYPSYVLSPSRSQWRVNMSKILLIGSSRGMNFIFVDFIHVTDV